MPTQREKEASHNEACPGWSERYACPETVVAVVVAAAAAAGGVVVVVVVVVVVAVVVVVVVAVVVVVVADAGLLRLGEKAGVRI